MYTKTIDRMILAMGSHHGQLLAIQIVRRMRLLGKSWFDVREELTTFERCDYRLRERLADEWADRAGE